ncbi:uncharacterized protein LOC107993132 isoform X2 [Apis cerana]|uniref:uncharacterized protein LOC107993132 isoform X2 n=1 Tax=Apis cerana TaxID=7461 RepID=UPI0007E2C181|nr:uncharacterized protein LOC107993132 isoform X2 [Apis cerana]
MKFIKTLFFIFICVILINNISTKFNIGKGFVKNRKSNGKSGNRKSYGSLYHTSNRANPNYAQANKNINTQFLNAESGGATRLILQNGEKQKNENKQTSSFYPSAPQQDHIMKSATAQNYDQITSHQTNFPWSNPYLGNNRQSTIQTHIINKPPISNQPGIVPNSQPPPIGFKDYVYPQSHITSANTQSIHREYPPYPTHHMPLSNTWPNSVSSLPYQTNSMPLRNPYSVHSSEGIYNTHGQPSYSTHYPTTHILAQPAVQPFVPGQTILMVPGQQDSGRGFGQMIKEALVFSTINAGVNRILNPHTTHDYVENRPDSTSTTTTHITYNNQYFNTPLGVNDEKMNSTNVLQVTGFPNNSTGIFTSNIDNVHRNGIPIIESHINENINTSTIVSSDQKNLSNNESISINNTFFYKISDDELFKISEELFAKSSRNIYKFIKLNLQTKVTSLNVTDEAKESLFKIESKLLDYPSIYVTRSLYNSYEYDFRKKLNRTLETRKQENLLIDAFLNTNEMTIAMQWLADHGFIDPDDFERKDVLRRIWFTIFSGSTCGFERVFASENYGTAIIGVQDWIYFEYLESLKRIDYMGYVDKLDFGNSASLLKLNFQIDGIVRSNVTIFVGTLPELEMALYTICFYARSNNLCPVSFGGTKFNIYTHSFIHFGNEVIDLGLPIF